MTRARRPLAAHVAAGPAGHRRQRRHERLRAGAGRRPGPGRCAVRRLRAPLARRPARRGRRRARVPGGPRRRPVRSTWPRRSCPRSSTSTPTGWAATCGARAAPTPSTPTTGCRAWPATGSSTSSRCRWCRPSTPWPGSRPRPATPSPTAGSTPRPRSSAAPTPSCASCAGRGRSQLVDALRRRPERIEIVPPGVDHAFFSPGDRAGRPRAPSGWATSPVLLFVGRIQPLKGARRRGRALAELSRIERPDAVLVVVGGRQRAQGGAELARVRDLVDEPRAGRPGALRRRRSPTTCCRPTTGPPTCASCRAAPSPSAWSPSRPRPAAPRGRRRRRWAAHPRRRTGAPASSSTAATRPTTPPHVAERPRRSRRSPPRWAGPRPSGPAATPGRPPRPACAGSTPTSPPGPRSLLLSARPPDAGRRDRRPTTLDALEARIDAWLRRAGRRQPRGGRRRAGRAGGAALVRAGAGRAEGHLHDLVHAAASGRCTTRPT